MFDKDPWMPPKKSILSPEQKALAIMSLVCLLSVMIVYAICT